MDQETNGVEKSYPICHSCGCDIICFPPGTQPFAIIVRDPGGRQHLGGEFCLECMTVLGLHGVLLHELPPDVAARRLQAIREKADEQG